MQTIWSYFKQKTKPEMMQELWTKFNDEYMKLLKQCSGTDYGLIQKAKFLDPLKQLCSHHHSFSLVQLLLEEAKTQPKDQLGECFSLALQQDYFVTLAACAKTVL